VNDIVKVVSEQPCLGHNLLTCYPPGMIIKTQQIVVKGIGGETRKDSPYKKWWDGRRRNQAVAEMIEEWAAEGVAGGGERNQVQCC
jgi:hypothetical protein